MACNTDLRNAGMAYPRTCADCGFGPCKKYPPNPALPVTAKTLADTILAMNYGELKKVAKEFAGMIEKDARPKVETEEEFADLLFDWAEAQRQ